MILVFVISYVQ